jgi:hypothetical protein
MAVEAHDLWERPACPVIILDLYCPGGSFRTCSLATAELATGPLLGYSLLR